MEKIQNYNCEGLCVEENCDEKYTHFCKKKVNGIKVILAFCRKHAEEFEENEN